MSCELASATEKPVSTSARVSHEPSPVTIEPESIATTRDTDAKPEAGSPWSRLSVRSFAAWPVEERSPSSSVCEPGMATQ